MRRLVLTDRQRELFAIVAAHAPISTGEVGRRLGITAKGAAQAVGALRVKGLIERRGGWVLTAAGTTRARIGAAMKREEQLHGNASE